jgi:hypothetical protein
MAIFDTLEKQFAALSPESGRQREVERSYKRGYEITYQTRLKAEAYGDKMRLELNSARASKIKAEQARELAEREVAQAKKMCPRITKEIQLLKTEKRTLEDLLQKEREAADEMRDECEAMTSVEAEKLRRLRAELENAKAETAALKRQNRELVSQLKLMAGESAGSSSAAQYLARAPQVANVQDAPLCSGLDTILGSLLDVDHDSTPNATGPHLKTSSLLTHPSPVLSNIRVTPPDENAARHSDANMRNEGNGIDIAPTSTSRSSAISCATNGTFNAPPFGTTSVDQSRSPTIKIEPPLRGHHRLNASSAKRPILFNNSDHEPPSTLKIEPEDNATTLGANNDTPSPSGRTSSQRRTIHEYQRVSKCDPSQNPSPHSGSNDQLQSTYDDEDDTPLYPVQKRARYHASGDAENDRDRSAHLGGRRNGRGGHNHGWQGGHRRRFEGANAQNQVRSAARRNNEYRKEQGRGKFSGNR